MAAGNWRPAGIPLWRVALILFCSVFLLMPNPYETRRLVDEYLLFHYGSAQENLPWAEGPESAVGFPVRTVTSLLPDRIWTGRALDAGCAVGRSSFELAKHFPEVVGIDYSHAFIDAARSLLADGTLTYDMAVEGHLKQTLQAIRPAFPREAKLKFLQGDAMNLPEDLGEFEVVHAANLVCRLEDPVRFLRRLPELVQSGGFLLLTTPCSWLKEYTPAKRWPKGSTLDWLQETLAPEFTLTSTQDLPFLIREHARKFQWSVALGTVWSRR